ncbi:MAG: hypothetical protein LLF89_08380 [Spirochaetaceae bacterium]|nr:hypothetical protein [Spirochaetaceae bacterium]
MTRQLTKNWTIRFKLSLFCPLIVSIVIIVFAFVLYGYSGRNLKADLDVFLQSKADGIEESIRTYWQAKGLSPAAGGNHSIEEKRRIDSKAFVEIARSWIDEQKNTQQFMAVGIQIFDSNGSIIAASLRLPSGIRISREAMDSLVTGDDTFETVKIKNNKNDNSEFRVYTRPIKYGDLTVYYVQVLSSLERVNSTLSNLKQTLLILIPIVVLITAIVMYFFTRASLMPIQRMIETIHGASKGTLIVKLDIPSSGKELRDLAVSFNSMMDRVDTSFKTQTRFFDDVSHQLKTPLAILKGDLETTLTRARSKEEYEQILESNLEEVNRMISLINKMLALARFDSGHVEPQMEQVSLSDFLGESKEEFDAIAVAHNSLLSIEVPIETTIFIDKEKTLRALVAIVENAIEHSPVGGTVIISGTEENGYPIIKVRDHGPGIPNQELERIFERFYRGSSAAGNGFGIGLSMAQSIMHLQGGEVFAENATDGGAIFSLRFAQTGAENQKLNQSEN